MNNDINKYLSGNTKSVRDYIMLIRTNLFPFILISVIIIVAVLTYALLSGDVYVSKVDLKINPLKQSVLESQVMPNLGSSVNDRFIANEIEIIKNYDSMEKYAKALIDSFDNSKNKNLFVVIKQEDGEGHKSLPGVIKSLKINAEQLTGLDIIEISAESPSPYEAALIANTCAVVYKKLNLENNRGQLTSIRKFLEEQSKEKLNELNNAEENLKDFQQQGGIVALDAQSTALINQLANLDAQRDAAKVDLLTSNEVLEQYKKEMSTKDPQLADYLESQVSQTYIDALQKQLADLQMNKDLALSNKNSNVDVTNKIQEYDKKILELKKKLNSVINDIKVGAYSSSPEQIRDLTQKLIDEKITNNSLAIKYNELKNIITDYEQNLNRLPKKSMELAHFQRKSESLQQLYQLVEQKHQEAMINELSQPGNVVMVSKGRVPDEPSKPNRILIIFLGVIFGPLIGFSLLVIRDYFDDAVKTPIDLEDSNINMLSWVPYLNSKEIKSDGRDPFDFIEENTPVNEAFRAIKARINYSRADFDFPKVIMVTSPAEQEGKTFVSVKLSASFAQSSKKTLLIDCDLRRPKIHTILGSDKKPGLVDYLYRQVKLEEVIRDTQMSSLKYITSGTLPLNSAEMFESKMMMNFLTEIRDFFDVIILDTAPIVAVIDAEILARLADGTILVVSADKTDKRLMRDAIDIIKRDKVPFLGAVLNNFKYKNGYGYYYKYYYNYPQKAVKRI